jgi:hypothetical protein
VLVGLLTAAAIVLGGLLLAGLIHHDPEQAVLLPAGGGTFGGATRHADADDPALSIDGRTWRSPTPARS